MEAIQTQQNSAGTVQAPRPKGATFLTWTGMLLVAMIWISAGRFGLYILAFYATALLNGEG